jgi:alpha-tubulin suppressor-like RCC1 family protein
LSNRLFVELVYRNVLGRDGDAAGIASWTKKLDSKAKTRGQVMVGFSESSEYQRKKTVDIAVLEAASGLLHRSPTTDELPAGGVQTLTGLIESIRTTSEYRVRLALPAPALPSAPFDVIATAGATGGFAAISWRDGSDGGMPITSYQVTPYVNGTPQTTRTVPATDATVTISGLNVGATYTFRISAVTKAGPSPLSAASGPVTMAAATMSRLSFSDVHGCGIFGGGVVQCWGTFWGENFRGELPREHYWSPFVVSGTGTATTVVSGPRRSCALSTTGAVGCWYFKADGDETMTLPFEIVSGPVAAGARHIALGSGTSFAADNDLCIVFTSGSVTCQPTPEDAATPVAGISDATKVAVGLGHKCAVTAAGKIACWGANGDGQLGDGTRTSRPNAMPVPGITGATAVTAGGHHACAIVANGAVKCWGDNTYGQLGDGTTSTDRLAPVTVVGLSGAVELSAGEHHTCARLGNGTVTCWGRNHHGQLGDGTLTLRPSPKAVPVLTGATSLTSDLETTCAVTADHLARCWGVPSPATPIVMSQVGPPTPAGTKRYTRTQNVSSFGEGGYYRAEFSCSRSTLGVVRCAGGNESGQIGNGTFADRLQPAAVSGLAASRALSVGRDHVCAVTQAASAVCWGSNDRGKLGDGSTTNRPTPVPVAGGLTNVTAIAAGFTSSCAVAEGGAVFCWGNNSSGQLGDGSTTNRTIPVQVSGLTGATAVSIGYESACALLANGAVKCWGDNTDGQLGDGTNNPSPTPVTVSISGVSAIDVGGPSACALRSDGSVWCWGSNWLGQLGDGTTTDRSIPVRVTDLGPAIAIGAGEQHTCAISTSRTVSCWGSNSSGQLGDGTSEDRLTPVAMTGVGDAVGLVVTDTTAILHGSGSVSTTGSPGDNTWNTPRVMVGY